MNLLLLSHLFLHAQAAVSEPPGLVSPPATAVEAPTVTAGVGTVVVHVEGYCVAAGGCGPAYSAALGATVGAEAPLGAHGAVGVVALGGWVEAGSFGGAGLRLRRAVVERPGLRVAPWVTLAGGALDGEGSLVMLGGMALDAGGDRARFDLSVPLLGILADPGTAVEAGVLVPAVAFGEMGVRFPVGSHSSLRLGTAGMAPGVDWRREVGGEGMVLEVGAHGLGFVNVGWVGLAMPL